MRVSIATNQPWMGGGEVMLVQLAGAARALGHEVTVVAPEGSDVARRARELGHALVGIHAATTLEYLRGLRRWASTTDPGLLWCNGLRPAFATTGLPRRVVHLHRQPSPAQHVAALAATRGARAVLVPSHHLAAALQPTLGRVEVLANWTSPLEHQPRGLLSDPPRVGFLGRTAPEKGLPDLVAAITALRSRRPVDLHVAGAPIGDDPPELEGVHVQHGWVDPQQFLHELDVLVVPSVRAESFGLVAAEAMACGTPVVVSDAGALPEVVGPDHRWVVPRHDPDRLAAALEQLLDQRADGRLADLDRARARWEAEFSPAAGASRVAALLDRLSDDPSGGTG